MSSAPQHRLIYLRHGETQWSRTGRHTGATDVPLTPVGQAQATALAPVLAGLGLINPTVWVSPRIRAQRTAELAGLTGSGVALTVEPDLAEWDYGAYEGITSATIRQTVPGWTVWDFPVPEGETLTEITARAERVLAEVTPMQRVGDVVLVGHGHFGRVLCARYLRADATFGAHLPILPASAAVFGYDHDGVPQLRQFGLTGYAPTS